MMARRSLLAMTLAVALAGNACAADCHTPRQWRLQNTLVALSNTIGPGVVNTAFGLLAVVGYTIAAPFSERIDLPRFRLSQSGIQIIATISDDWYEGGTSLGLFLIEGRNGERYESDEEYQLHALHEAGHAYQSALLGPLYLPVIGFDYAIHGGGNHAGYFRHKSGRGGFSNRSHDDAWVETWADRIASHGGPTDDLSASQIHAMIGCKS